MQKQKSFSVNYLTLTFLQNFGMKSALLHLLLLFFLQVVDGLGYFLLLTFGFLFKKPDMAFFQVVGPLFILLLSCLVIIHLS